MTRVVSFAAFCLIAVSVFAADSPADGKKYLIIHADDAGMSHSVNRATIDSMERGVVSSTSIMVPCPWFPEFAEYAKSHPEGDYGIHLTLNSEWKHYRWGPVAPRHKVKSLLGKDGFLLPDVPDTFLSARASEVEIELKAQIDRALEAGVPISHLDTHMGAAVSRPDLIEVYVKLGIEYNLPVMWSRTANEEVAQKYPFLLASMAATLPKLEEAGLPLLDQLTTTVGDGTPEQRRAAYMKFLRDLKPGITQLIVHCGYYDDELKAITHSARDRDTDREVFMDPKVIAEIEKLGIEVVSWKQVREMRDKERGK